MGKKNIASTGFTPVQVGRVVDGEKAKKPAKAEKPAKAADEGTVTNVRSGNAKVGRQADEIHGGLTIRMPRR
ncbi:hypothetical protein [Streptosporangium roseum]|uniref:hypothetical protein n=1 Tax=Streptosporangium roseum TaxID=2001 RepID=UPI00331F793E